MRGLGDMRILVILGIGSVLLAGAAQGPTTARNSLIISCHNQVPSEYVLFIIDLAERVVHIQSERGSLAVGASVCRRQRLGGMLSFYYPAAA